MERDVQSAKHPDESHAVMNHQQISVQLMIYGYCACITGESRERKRERVSCLVVNPVKRHTRHMGVSWTYFLRKCVTFRERERLLRMQRDASSRFSQAKQRGKKWRGKKRESKMCVAGRGEIIDKIYGKIKIVSRQIATIEGNRYNKLAVWRGKVNRHQWAMCVCVCVLSAPDSLNEPWERISIWE